jgi:alpha-tubulin suppressor-like RCC1 family protein
MRRILVSLVLVLTLSGVLVVAPGATVEAQAASAKVSALGFAPGSPVLGDPLRVTGTVSTKVVRPVQLQRKAGKKWTVVASTTTTARGAFGIDTVAVSRSTTFRVVAPTVRIGKRTYAQATSRSTVVTTAELTPAHPVAGQPFILAGTLPKKVARPVVLQRLDGKTWRTMATASSDRKGAFRLTSSTALSTITVRPYAAKVKISHKTYAKYVGPTTTIRTMAPAPPMPAPPVPPPPVPPQPAITTTSLPEATVGVAYSVPVTATGGTPPYTWTAIGLLSGLAIDPATGVISGTPSASGTSSATIMVTDHNLMSAAVTVPLVVTVAPLAITTTGLPAITAGSAYSAALRASGGVPPYEWSSTALPSGISLDPDTGVLSGVGTDLGAYPVTVSVSDRDGTLQTADLRLIVSAGKAVRLAAGIHHACAITDAGLVWCWGGGSNGQLGDGTMADRSTPTPVPGLSGVSGLAAGAYHTCAVRAGEVYCWGWDGDGQVAGSPTSNNVTAPVKVAGLGRVKKVTAGYSHTCALTSAGDVYCWGSNADGQLGLGTVVTSSSPARLPGLSDIVDIAAGQDHTCAVRAAGGVVCWGKNGFGQAGSGTSTVTTPTPMPGLTGVAAIRVASGTRHTCVVTESGSAWCWGANDAGQLGNGTTAVSGTPSLVTGLAGVAELAGGLAHTCALITSGGAACWGYNLWGQLGDGTVLGRQVATAVADSATFTSLAAGWQHTCAGTVSGGVRCWGYNQRGQLGNGSSGTDPVPSPVTVAAFDG